MDKTPFSFYDFFGYLAPAILLTTAIDFALNNQALIHYAGSGVINGIVSLLLIYIVGHTLATPAGWLYETLLVKKILNKPSEVLLFNVEKKVGKKLFRGYYTALPVQIQEKIIEKAGESGIKTDHKAIYQFAFSKVKSNHLYMERLNTFLNLYGFARNISFVCFVITFVLLFSALFYDNIHLIKWALLMLIPGMIMLYRFLKFYRHYAYELFLSFISN